MFGPDLLITPELGTANIPKFPSQEIWYEFYENVYARKGSIIPIL